MTHNYLHRLCYDSFSDCVNSNCDIIFYKEMTQFVNQKNNINTTLFFQKNMSLDSLYTKERKKNYYTALENP